MLYGSIMTNYFHGVKEHNFHKVSLVLYNVGWVCIVLVKQPLCARARRSLI